MASSIYFRIFANTVAPQSHDAPFTGIGPAQIGMTETQVRKVLAGPFQVNDQAGDDSFECYYLEPRAVGISFMFLDKALARVDVYETPWRTVSGAGVGTTEAQIHRL